MHTQQRALKYYHQNLKNQQQLQQQQQTALRNIFEEFYNDSLRRRIFQQQQQQYDNTDDWVRSLPPPLFTPGDNVWVNSRNINMVVERLPGIRGPDQIQQGRIFKGIVVDMDIGDEALSYKFQSINDYPGSGSVYSGAIYERLYYVLLENGIIYLIPESELIKRRKSGPPIRRRK
jgi:hypothetical protein